MKPKSRADHFERLRSLKCYDEVYKRICAGWPATQLARFIQEERNEYTQASQKQLERLLREFRQKIPPGDLVAKRFPEVFEDAKDKIEQGLDEIAELEELYRIQMHRVGIDLVTETKINKLLPSMTSEIKEARQILESLAELKMDLGIHQRAANKVDVNVEGEVSARLETDLTQYPDSVQGVLDDAEKRRRLHGLVGRFLQLEDGDTAESSDTSTVVGADTP